MSAGSVLSGGGSVPALKASTETWVNTVNAIQKGSLSTRLGIPMIYGIDAVHGHNNVYNATVFPHNVGLGVTRQALESWSGVMIVLVKQELSQISHFLPAVGQQRSRPDQEDRRSNGSRSQSDRDPLCFRSVHRCKGLYTFSHCIEIHFFKYKSYKSVLFY